MELFVTICNLSDVILSEDNPLDFHDKINHVLSFNLKYLPIGWNTK